MNKKYLKKGKYLRPLLLVSAVGMVCQHAYAQNIETLSATPFAKRPLHLLGETTDSGVAGVKPNVLFFIDDSGSMSSAVPGSGGKNRTQVVQDALIAILNNYGDEMRWSMYSLWGMETRPRPNPPRAVNHGFLTAAQMRPLVNQMGRGGGTPTTRRYLEAVRILRDGIQYRCQKNYIIVMSDGDANAAAGVRRPGTNMYDPGNGAGLPPFTETWESIYGIFTNGRPFESTAEWGNFFSTYDYQAASGSPIIRYHPYASGLTNGIALFSHILKNADLRDSSHGRDAEGGHWDLDSSDSNPVMHNTAHGKQSIETYTIGFGGGLTTGGQAYLVDAATCASTSNINDKLNKCYFAPTTGNQLSHAFDEIMRQIEEANQSSAQEQTFSASTPSTSGSTIAELAATLTLDTGKWSSQLLFAKFSGGALENSVEQAQYGNRRVMVNNGLNNANSIYWLDNTTPATRKADFGIRNDQEFTRAFVPWLTRNASVTDAQIAAQGKAVAAANRTVSVYRERATTATDPARQMADVIGTPVVAMGKVAPGNNKQKYVLTAANDGMVYIFSTAENTSEYNLALNYLPAGMQRQSALPASDPMSITVGKTVRVTAEADYGKNDVTNPHVYLNNGGLSWVRTPKTGGRNQEEILLGTMGQGGRGAYALRIAGFKRSSTNMSTPAGLDATPASWTTEVPLWETEKSATNALGYTISTGMIGQVATRMAGSYPDVEKGVHVYAFVANGYATEDSAVPYDASPTLYVYDMMGQEFGHDTTMSSATVANGNQPGQLITKLSTGNPAGALSTPTLLDSDQDSMIDFAYAGDKHGDLYRFDLRGAPSTWASKVRKIYDGDTNQPITAAPALYKIDNDNFVVIFGTGSDVYLSDRTVTDAQMVMGIHDDLTNDTPSALIPTDRDKIVDQTISVEGGYRYLSTNEFTTGTHRAWRIMLKPGVYASADNITSSEGVVSKPQVLTRTAFFTTRIYEFKQSTTSLPQGVDPNNTCYSITSEIDTGGTSWQMAVDALTGAGPAAGESADKTVGAYFAFTDEQNLAPSAPGSGQNRRVPAGLDLGYLSSAPALVNTSSSNANHLQNNAHGELGYSGEIVSAFDRSPAKLTGTYNPLDDLKTSCINRDDSYTLLLATAGAKSGQQHNLMNLNLVAPVCPDPLSQGKTLIRVDWRNVPL